MDCISQHHKFQDLVNLFNSILKVNKPIKRYNLLDRYIRNHREKGQELKRINPNVKVSFYPFLRLMLPQLERERESYGLKETAFAKLIVKMLKLNSKGLDAQYLLDGWRTAGNASFKDFADATQQLLKTYFSEGPGVTVFELNGFLDRIASGDVKQKEKELHQLFKAVSLEERKWIIRIILKSVKLGMGHNKILHFFHRDAPGLFDTNNSLEMTCETLHDPSVKLNEVQVSMFAAFRPMLSQRCDVKEFNKAVRDGRTFLVETKFDGERFQLHMKDGRFKYFSRRGFDFTGTFGEGFHAGLYTPLLEDVIDESVSSFILDGEMMGWNRATKEFGSKGMTFDVKKLTSSSLHQPCLCVFDILLLNDEILTNKPLEERMGILKTILRPKVGVLLVSTSSKVTTRQDLITALNESVDEKLEGIVFKDPSSKYVLNERNAGWWKLKLEYFEGVMSDLDVIIMGGYYGEGRKRTRVSGFLVGVSHETHQLVEYFSLAKISTGLNDAELDDLEAKLRPFWHRTSEESGEEFGLKFGKEQPDVWVEPEHSCILQVRGSELTKVTNREYATPYTLRFPRIQKIRWDKAIEDCLSLKELNDLSGDGQAVEKLNKRHLELSDLKQVTARKKPKLKLIPREIVDVEAKSQLLLGLEFVVLSGNENWSKRDVEIAIKENGGTVVLHERDQTYCILVGWFHPRASLYAGNKDIVKIEWLRRVIEGGKLRFYQFGDIEYLSEATKLRFKVEYDKFGDSFVEESSEEDLRRVVRKMIADGVFIDVSPMEVEELNREMNIS